MVLTGLAIAAAVCALQTVRAPRLLPATLWLAGASAFTSMLLYSLGARQAAVLELSIGAGLILILFIFTINLAGEAGPAGASPVRRAAAWCTVGLVGLLLGELAWPRLERVVPVQIRPLSASLWADRPFDVLAQIVLIFAGALTIVGLLAPDSGAAAEERAAADRVVAAPPEQGKRAMVTAGTPDDDGRHAGRHDGRPEPELEEALP